MHGILIFVLLLLFQYLTSTQSSRSDLFSRIEPCFFMMGNTMIII